MKALLLSLLLVTACAGTNPYRDTWQPVSMAVEQASPRVVTVALLVDQLSDEQAMIAAGGKLIGHHETQQEWAQRAGSTGGTHFMPVRSAIVRSHAHCHDQSARCDLAEVPRPWSRVAVFRVPPDRWHLLPPHLVPLEQTARVRASAVRTGCAIDAALGTTKCRADWAIDT